MTSNKKTTAHRADKRKKMDNTRFCFTQHFERYNQFFEKAPIIQERFVDLVDLKDYFILGCFQDRGWDKLLGDLPGVSEPLIREFYANAILQKDEIDCWLRGHEFTIDLEDIDDVLGFEDLEHDFTHYKDRMLSIETVQSYIGSVRKGRCLNTTAFPLDLRCLTLIMMFNLYPVKKMTTISNARAIFLMELRENTYIDISAHAFSIIANETRTTSWAKLILPSLLMRLFQAKGDEEEGDQAQGEPMDIETEAEGQPSSSRSHGKRSQSSSSFEVPLDAFQIIVERIDSLRDVQNEQSDRLTAIQEQTNLLSPSLIASLHSLSPLAIPVKNGEIWSRSSS